jgi:hypothetical protein
MVDANSVAPFLIGFVVGVLVCVVVGHLSGGQSHGGARILAGVFNGPPTSAHACTAPSYTGDSLVGWLVNDILAAKYPSIQSEYQNSLHPFKVPAWGDSGVYKAKEIVTLDFDWSIDGNEFVSFASNGSGCLNISATTTSGGNGTVLPAAPLGQVYALFSFDISDVIVVPTATARAVLANTSVGGSVDASAVLTASIHVGTIALLVSVLPVAADFSDAFWVSSDAPNVTAISISHTDWSYDGAWSVVVPTKVQTDIYNLLKNEVGNAVKSNQQRVRAALQSALSASSVPQNAILAAFKAVGQQRKST